MRAIRRDQHKRYAAMQAMLYDLRHLDEVLPQRYLPASPLLGGGYRQVIHLLCIVLLVCLGIIAFGMLAQFAHHAVR